MGIKSTKNIKKRNAIEYFERINVNVYDNDCVERIQDLLDAFSHDEYSNYAVYERHDENVIDCDKHAEWTIL